MKRVIWEGCYGNLETEEFVGLAKARLDMDAEDAHQRFMEQQTKEYGRQGALISYYEFQLGMSHKEAVRCAKQQIADEKEAEEDTLTEDELEGIISGVWLKNEFYGDG